MRGGAFAHTPLMASAPTHSVVDLSLIATKLYLPKWRPGLVSRPDLVARLSQGTGRKLTLVSAPAGFGKTTLLAEWLAAAPVSARAAAWVSLDETDNDPALFWAYVITALQKVQAEVGQSALSLLQSPQPPPIESILTTVLNEIAAIEDDFALILDDFHVIDAPPIHAAVAFLLDHLPPGMHLVIATREDPRLPLPRLRARGQLTELRAADLRFTPDEAAAFLNQAMGLNLLAADVVALETRTEGWIAGLQLAALSLRGRADVRGFVRAFAGDDRYIVDYLVEEVLQRQPARVRSFLLQTSVLDRLSGPLCDAITGQEDGKALLEILERGNLFVVPLDDKRQWYRYHHLFADVLRAYAQDEEAPDRIAVRHRRASEWYETNGLRAIAIRHALAAGDFARGADLVELAVPVMRRSRQEGTLLGWLTALPDELIRCRPVLSVAHAWVLFASGNLDAVEARLRDAERWLEPEAARTEQPQTPSAGMVVVDEEEFRRLPGSIAVYRAARALLLGDVAATVIYARQALLLISADDHLRHGAAAALLGLASWANGDLEAAHQAYADGMESLQRAGHVSDVITGAVTRADIKVAQGSLNDAERILAQAVRRAAEQTEPGLLETPGLLLGLSELRCERNDVHAATQHLLRSQELAVSSGLPQNQSRWCVAMAQIREAEGDLDGALDLIEEAERRYVRDYFPNVRPLAALKVRLWIAQGQLDDAAGWARERGLSAKDDLSYVREFEHLTLARVLIAHYASSRTASSIREATALLDRLLNAAERGERMGSVIEILVMQARSQTAQSDIPRALVPLERALLLAEPEGYVRTFVGEGAAMQSLLRHVAAGGIAAAYALRLLGNFDEPVPPPSAPARASTITLAEPLTVREVEILRLIAAGLRNQEIADRLFIGLATVKRHVANAYGKLGAGHRTEAIVRANELNLL